MSIPDTPKNINIVLLIVVIVVLGFFFGFGSLKLSHLLDQKQPIRVVSAHSDFESSQAVEEAISGVLKGDYRSDSSIDSGKVVASKTGTRFYLPNCAGVSRILDKNKVYFENADAALKAGLTPAVNCKGLHP